MRISNQLYHSICHWNEPKINRSLQNVRTEKGAWRLVFTPLLFDIQVQQVPERWTCFPSNLWLKTDPSPQFKSAPSPHPFSATESARFTFYSRPRMCQFMSMCQNPLDASDRKPSSNWPKLKKKKKSAHVTEKSRGMHLDTRTHVGFQGIVSLQLLQMSSGM